MTLSSDANGKREWEGEKPLGLCGQKLSSTEDARRVDRALDLDEPWPVGAVEVLQPAFAAAVGVRVQCKGGLVGRWRSIAQLASETARFLLLVRPLVDDDEGNDAELGQGVQVNQRGSFK